METLSSVRVTTASPANSVSVASSVPPFSPRNRMIISFCPTSTSSFWRKRLYATSPSYSSYRNSLSYFLPARAHMSSTQEEEEEEEEEDEEQGGSRPNSSKPPSPPQFPSSAPAVAFSAAPPPALLSKLGLAASSLLSPLLLFSLPALALLSSSSPLSFPCEDVAQYYSRAEGLSGQALKEELHRATAQGQRVLKYAEVWSALSLLDAADVEHPEEATDVIGIYSLRPVPKESAATPEGWNREHLWPRSFGLPAGSPQFTDLHNLRPADVNVNSARGNKWFGDCSSPASSPLLASSSSSSSFSSSSSASDVCVVPANREAAPDTATSRRVWMPPAKVRGDIARALLYMTVRYDGVGAGEAGMDLELSDHPDAASARMGLLSSLLRWHVADPPSADESVRNSRVCSLFQHNRNPFVDHPQYAEQIWGAGAGAGGGASSSPIKSSTSPPSLPFSGRDGAVGPTRAAWVNEMHYSNRGPDQGEFLELVVSPSISPSSLSLVLYNGADGKPYRTLPVQNFSLGQVSSPGGFKILALLLPPNSIQNGPADGVALLHCSTASDAAADASSSSSCAVLQFLSYSGSLTAASGPAAGLTSVDIGVEEGDSAPETGSVGLAGNGVSYEQFSWRVLGHSSFGRLNEGQRIEEK